MAHPHADFRKYGNTVVLRGVFDPDLYHLRCD
jgi:hypothetical protein